MDAFKHIAQIPIAISNHDLNHYWIDSGKRSGKGLVTNWYAQLRTGRLFSHGRP
jgi:hypothetical protein